MSLQEQQNELDKELTEGELQNDSIDKRDCIEQEIGIILCLIVYIVMGKVSHIDGAIKQPLTKNLFGFIKI